MDNQGQKVEKENQQPPSSLASKHVMSAADAEALLTVNHLQPAHKPKDTKHLLIYVGLVVVLIILLSLISLFHKTTTPKNSGAITTSSQVGNSNLPNPSQNPLNDNGSIGSQVKYCSNPVNASLVC